MAIDASELGGMMNQFNVNRANNILGSPSNTSVGPISGDMLQQWSMRGPNASAYRKLLEAEKTGSVKGKDVNDYELMSDRYYNDSYKKDSTGKVNYTYQPEKVATAADGDVLSQLEALRNIASAAASNPNSINDTYLNLFNTMRQNVANALVTKGGATETTTTTTEAQPATLSAKGSFRYLDEDQRFTVAGKAGEKSYSFEAGTSLNAIAEAINADSTATGVKAEVILDSSGNASNIKLTSTEAGKEAFVRVDQTAGALFAETGKSTSAAGKAATETTNDVVAKGGDTKAAIATGIYGGIASGAQEFTVTGAKGSKTFQFADKATAEEIADAINAASAETGVNASLIRNSAGQIEGIGLESADAGQYQFVKVDQKEGYLFNAPGSGLSVYGQSENPSGANAVNSLSQFGKIKWGGETYSFADIMPGGRVSLDKNPDIATAILDQALQDVFGGAAALKGVDMETAVKDHSYTPTSDNRMGSSPTNAIGVNDFGSAAIAKWVSDRVKIKS